MYILKIKNRLKSVTLFLILISTFISNLSAVQVTGSGENRKSAIVSALQTAIKQELEKSLSKDEIKKGGEVVNSLIRQDYGEFIAGFKVTDENQTFGITKVFVEAEIMKKELNKKLFDSKIIFGIKGKPRVMILLEERIAGQPSFEKTASFAFEKIFLNKGFKLVEPAKSTSKESLKNLSDEELAKVAFRSGADLLIKGNISVGKGRLSSVYGIEHYSVPIQMNVHIVRADNGEIVATRSKRLQKNAQDEFSAGQFGLDVGGKMLAKTLVTDLSNIWQEEIFKKGGVELVAKGQSNLLPSLEKGIGSLPFVKSISLRYLESGSALYDVEMAGSIQDLREAVSKSKQWSVSLLTGNRLGIVAKSQTPKAISYDYQEPAVQIKSLNFNPIFPSRSTFYENSEVVDVKLLLEESADISNLKLSIIIPELMSLPIEKKISTLTPGEEITVKLALPMNSEKLLKNRSTKQITGEATLSFMSGGKQITRKLTARTTLHDANAMNWAEINSIGSFVTYRNPVVDRFARSAVAQTNKKSINTQFEAATAIFSALKQYQISYIQDPAIEAGGAVLDKVQYPIETLRKKSGDCDDSSVLFASLLASVGIDCAFMSYPDHVLIMFDTGIYKKNVHKLGASEKDVVIHKNRCWIPVETTLLKKDFITAWQTASREYKQALKDGENIDIVELKTAWNVFPPFNDNRDDATIKAGDISATLSTQLSLIDTTLKTVLNSTILGLENSSRTPSQDNELGKLYAFSGAIDKSIKLFEGAATKNKNAELYNNYGCALLLSGDEKEALKQIEKSIAIEKSAAALVNRSLCYYIAAQDGYAIEKFIISLQEANGVLPEGETLADILGIDLAQAGELERAAGEHDEEAPQTIDKRRLQELIRKRVLSRNLAANTSSGDKSSSGKNIMPFGGVRGADPTQISKIADLLFWMELN
jgi:tetratricopeptide (TPR) repeat protein